MKITRRSFLKNTLLLAGSIVLSAGLRSAAKYRIEQATPRSIVQLPSGYIIQAPLTPKGFLPCDGRELYAADYPNLYKVIKNKYSRLSRLLNLFIVRPKFRLPDLTGKMVSPVPARAGDQQVKWIIKT